MADHPSNSEPLAFDIDSATKATNTGRTTLFNEIKEGRLKARKVGRKTIITRDDLRSWLNGLPARAVREAA